MRLYLETLLLKFLFYGFHRKDFDGLNFICGYLIMLGSIILLLIIYKTGYASKSLVWVWGVTHPSSIIPSNMAKRTQPKKKKTPVGLDSLGFQNILN